MKILNSFLKHKANDNEQRTYTHAHTQHDRTQNTTQQNTNEKHTHTLSNTKKNLRQRQKTLPHLKKEEKKKKNIIY